MVLLSGGQTPFSIPRQYTVSQVVSPLKKGEAVEVLRLAPEKACTGDMLVLIRWHDRKVAIPLSQLTAIDENESTDQAVADLEVLGSARLPILNLTARLSTMQHYRKDTFLTLRALKNNRLRNEVVVCRDGAEALDYLFKTGKYAGQGTKMPELILLDLKLPLLDGLEVLRGIRADESTRFLPAIIMTSSDDERDRIKGYGLGAIG